MHKNILDQARAALITIGRNMGIGVAQPQERRVENARMSQTRLKALEKLGVNADERASLKTGDEIDGDAEIKFTSIDSRAKMSHFRLTALAAVLGAENPPLHPGASEQKSGNDAPTGGNEISEPDEVS